MVNKDLAKFCGVLVEYQPAPKTKNGKTRSARIFSKFIDWQRMEALCPIIGFDEALKLTALPIVHEWLKLRREGKKWSQIAILTDSKRSTCQDTFSRLMKLSVWKR